MKPFNIALIGNPNCGKSTLFNQLTGANQRVGNWAGVTVERKDGVFQVQAQSVHITDLPGTYSLSALSEDASLDEQIACHFLLNEPIDLIVNVLDASSLERGLYLTLQLLSLGIPVLIALNMLDVAQKRNYHIDIDALSAWLNCPVLPLISHKGEGVAALKQAIISTSSATTNPQIAYPLHLLQEANYLGESLNMDNLPPIRRQGLGIQILEGDLSSLALQEDLNDRLKEAKERLKSEGINDPALAIAKARYQYIHQLCQMCVKEERDTPKTFTHTLDNILLNRFLGLPIFFFIMYLMFVFTINVGGAIAPLFDSGAALIFIDGVQYLGAKCHLPEFLTTFLAQGIGGGINTVLALVPQIGVMYLCLSFLEDSGYMARAAFVMDRLMQILGLPGKSFVPLIVGFGCNVPSVMGARTLDTPRERIMTIMMAPFIPCGARLAIFAVFSSAFFQDSGAFLVFSLYVLGIGVAILTGLVLKHTLLQGEASPFVLELPNYHCPTLKSLSLQTWQRLRGFVIHAGQIIVIVSIFLTLLNHFSLTGKPVSHINDSALASVSQKITPIFRPIGIHQDNWQATVGLFTGAMAKEVVIGTLNTLYTAQNMEEDSFNADAFDFLGSAKEILDETLSGLKETFSFGVWANPIEASMGDAQMTASSMGRMHQQFGSVSSAYAYLLFVLLYIPCISVMGAIARETHIKWMMFSIFWGINIAYSLATLFYQSVHFSEHPLFSGVCIVCVIVFNALVISVLRKQKIKLSPLPKHTCPSCNRCRGCH